MAELLVEANQELPEWFEKFVNETQRYGVRGTRGRGGNNANRFGGRDHRVQSGGMAAGNNTMGSMRYNPTPSYAQPPPQQNAYWNGNGAAPRAPAYTAPPAQIQAPASAPVSGKVSLKFVKTHFQVLFFRVGGSK